MRIQLLLMLPLVLLALLLLLLLLALPLLLLLPQCRKSSSSLRPAALCADKHWLHHHIDAGWQHQGAGGGGVYQMGQGV